MRRLGFLRTGQGSGTHLHCSQRVSVVLTGHQVQLLVDPSFFLLHVSHELLVLQGLFQPLAPGHTQPGLHLSPAAPGAAAPGNQAHLAPDRSFSSFQWSTNWASLCWISSCPMVLSSDSFFPVSNTDCGSKHHMWTQSHQACPPGYRGSSQPANYDIEVMGASVVQQ